MVLFLTINAGEDHAVLGPSAAGKPTLDAIVRGY